MSFRGGPLKHERSSKLSATVREGVDKTQNISEHAGAYRNMKK